MTSGNEAVDVLLLVALIAPIAVYFLLLGLVNSHARPCLISSRSDFVALTCAVMPLLIAPVPALVRAGTAWLVSVEAAIAAWAFFSMLPKSNAGWVVYNISPVRCRAVLESCLRQIGWEGTWDADTWQGEEGTVHVSHLSLLRNCSIHLELRGSATERATELGGALEERLSRIGQLPSTAGICMLMLGAMLLTVPVWMMGRHIQELVEAVVHLLG